MLKGKGIITENQKWILSVFSRLPDANIFYLSGGTALAEFYIGHRRSYDLDLFTAEKDLLRPFSVMMEEKFKKENFSIAAIRRFETFAEFEIGKKEEKTRVHLAYDSPFKFNKPVQSDIGIKVNDYKDLTVDKLLAFFGRSEPRDAVDLFFILKKENFWELARFASQKDPGFDFYWMAVALEKVSKFPDNIESWPVEMVATLEVSELKNMFLNVTRQIMSKIKGG